MNGHPEPGALRAWLDGERPDLTEHVTSCAECRKISEEQAAVADLSASALAVVPAAVDVESALLTTRPRARTEVVASRAPRQMPRWINKVAAAVIAFALIGGVTATPGGRAYASAFLDNFRAERLAVVPVDFAAIDPAVLESLVEVADVQGLDDVVEPKEVANLAEAKAISGIDATPLDKADIPKDATGPVRIVAQEPKTVRVNFADTANVPVSIRPATLVLKVPGAVVQAVGGDNAPALIRGDAGTLEVAVEGGPTLPEVREALLALPGLPADTVAALRAIENWETTLPLPIPAKQFYWENTKVNGNTAIAFGDETGIASAVVWRDGNHFHGVGGTLPQSEAKRIAERA